MATRNPAKKTVEVGSVYHPLLFTGFHTCWVVFSRRMSGCHQRPYHANYIKLS